MKVILDENHLIRLIKADMHSRLDGKISAIKFSNTKQGIEVELIVTDYDLSEPQGDVEIKRPSMTVEDNDIINNLK
jgi:hypothetical protein